MKKIILTALTLGVVAGAYAYLAQTDRMTEIAQMLGLQAATIEVYPRPAKQLRPIELGDLIVTAMPQNGFEKIGWDHLGASKSILWQTEGTAEAPGGKTVRVGFARVTVAGIKSTVLREAREELVWSVTLGTDASGKFGPKWISIEPGFAPGNQCFGSLNEGCTFTAAQALSSPKLKSKPLCQFSGRLDGETEVFLISADGKSPSVLFYNISGGSGGAAAYLEIRPFYEQKAICDKGRLQP